MDVSILINRAIGLAEAAAAIIPGADTVADVISIGKKVTDLLDDLKADATPEQQGEMQRTRAALADAVRAKAATTSKRLRG